MINITNTPNNHRPQIPEVNGSAKPFLDLETDELKLFLTKVEHETRVLERMIAYNLIENPKETRVGSELEMFIIRSDSMEALPASLDILKSLAPKGPFSPELGAFNLETQSSVYDLSGSVFSDMEDEFIGLMLLANKEASLHGGKVLLTGVLPTLIPDDVTPQNRTALHRYEQINRLLTERVGGTYRIQLPAENHTLTIEAKSNTLAAAGCGFQPNIQVHTDDFVDVYNIMQAISPLMLAVTANSPIIFAQQAFKDSRTPILEQMHNVQDAQGLQKERWSLGEDWIKDIIDPFQFNTSFLPFFSTLQQSEEECHPLDLPYLRQQSNTVWLYNRPRFEIQDGLPTIRIEHRVPTTAHTIVDNITHQAFFIGLSYGLLDELRRGTIEAPSRYPFADLKTDMQHAARLGLEGTIHWQGQSMTALSLARNLLPTAEAGLRRVGIDSRDRQHYLGLLSDRLAKGICPADWILELAQSMDLKSITREIYRAQMANRPLHLD